MDYQKELSFLCRTLGKLSLRFFFFTEKEEGEGEPFDGGLRDILGVKEERRAVLLPHCRAATDVGIYTFTDRFLCSYSFLRLLNEGERFLFIGPYRREGVGREAFLERLHSLFQNEEIPKAASDYYERLPPVRSDHALFVLLESFGDLLWGKDGYVFHTVKEKYEIDLQKVLSRRTGGRGATLPAEKELELRYAYENEMMDIISHGQAHRLSLLQGLSAASMGVVEKRSESPLRNLQNYGVIFNTLSRKAAEGGGVHPIHLDSVSRHFALKIEGASSTAELSALLGEIAYTYCRLVQKHSLKSYSPPVQKAIAYINADPCAALSLSAIASRLGLSASYFSDLFKKETGRCLTEYVNEKKMELAASLLTGTDERVGEIAAAVGIPDLQYFSKLFKKSKGETPLEYRKRRIAAPKIR